MIMYNQEGMRNNPNVEMQIQRRSIYEADGSGLSQWQGCGDATLPPANPDNFHLDRKN